MLFLLGACEDRIRFEQPQPAGNADLQKFPGRLRGTYFSESDSTYLLVDQHQIVEWFNAEANVHRDSLALEIDSAKIGKVDHDAVQVSESNYTLTFKPLSKDSVIVSYSYRDTVFRLSEEHILRKLKGHYLLNYRLRDGNWRVRRLTSEKGELLFSKVTMPKDIEELQNITEVQEIQPDISGAAIYRIKPSKRELKQLMKHQFREGRRYRKIKLSKSM